MFSHLRHLLIYTKQPSAVPCCGLTHLFDIDVACSLQITGVLTFTAACASAGITTFVNDDVEACFENHCPSFMAATALAFLTWFTVAPCCVLNLGSVIHKLQRP
jgi:hypothetical protein